MSTFQLKFPHERRSPIKYVLSGKAAIDILTFQFQQIVVRLKPGLPHARIGLFNLLPPLFFGCGGHCMHFLTLGPARYLKANAHQTENIRRLSRPMSKRL